jgi:hypothetical protein
VAKGQRISAGWANTLVDAARGARMLPQDGVPTVQSRDGVLLPRPRQDSAPRPYPPDDPFPWGPRWCWGLDYLFPPGTEQDPIDTPTVVIFRGALRRGPLTVYTAASTRIYLADDAGEDEVTVPIVWQLDPSGNVLTALRWTEETDPYDHDGLLVGLLYEIGLSWGLNEDDEPDPEKPILRLIRDIIHGTVFPTVFG